MNLDGPGRGRRARGGGGAGAGSLYFDGGLWGGGGRGGGGHFAAPTPPGWITGWGQGGARLQGWQAGGGTEDPEGEGASAGLRLEAGRLST